MKKTIHCTKCHGYVGEIRDATLKKGLRYICESCDTKPSDFVKSFLGDMANKRKSTY